MAHFFRAVDHARITLPSGSASKEKGLVEGASVSQAVVASAAWLPVAGTTLRWDGRSVVHRDVGLDTVSEHVQPSSFRVQGPPATPFRPRPYWTTGEICLVPTVPPQAIAWDKEAARVAFSLCKCDNTPFALSHYQTNTCCLVPQDPSWRLHACLLIQQARLCIGQRPGRVGYVSRPIPRSAIAASGRLPGRILGGPP